MRPRPHRPLTASNSFKCGRLCDLKLEQAESFAKALEELAAQPSVDYAAFLAAQRKVLRSTFNTDMRDRALFDAGVFYGRQEVKS